MKKTRTYTESELVEGCQKGQAETQRALYQQYYRLMYAVCMRYTDRREDAEDVFQEAFIKVFRGIQNFRGKGSLEGWIRRIMIRTALEFYRRNSRHMHVVGLEEAETIELDESVLSRFGREELLKAIRKLSPGYRTVFNMYEVEGYSHKEISLTLDISEGTSKSQLSRAKKMLQKELQSIRRDYYAG